MATYQALKTRIADELSRDDLATQTISAIASAIQHHESKRFTFNEKRFLLPTVAGTEYYALTSMTQTDGSALGTDETLLEVDSITILINSEPYTLRDRTQQWLDRFGGGTTRGQPYDYGIFGNQIRLYPIPDAVYSLTISGLARLPTLSGDSDSNGWTEDGEALIRSEAKLILYRDILRDTEGAQLAASAVDRALEALQRKAVAKLGTGRIAPWGH
jgi:hypothetical protein